MTDISLSFEVHQPTRLKRDFFWNNSLLRKVSPDPFNAYFDKSEDKKIFDRISSKCYLPANNVIFEAIKKFEDSERPFKAAYSFSGIFLEQCQKYRPEVLDSFVSLVNTNRVEVMEQTYYHSLTSLFEDKQEFKDQVLMHREAVWEIFGVKPTTFENTELIYNDEIAKLIEGLGYKSIFTEGIVADPNYVYRPKDTEISLLLRHYQLTDDIGFRFSSKLWDEYPLTADKYAAWLSAAPGKCINIFCDYETFGEHQWAETGIFEFLKSLPIEVMKHDNLCFATPTEINQNNDPIKDLSVKKTVSWADLERDTSCWLGNALQQACFLYLRRLERPVKESRDSKLLEIWRQLSLSDHLYYLFSYGGGPGEVHSYFSPYNNPFDAAITYFSILTDFHYRLKERFKFADAPFEFAKEIDKFTGGSAWSLEGLASELAQAELESIEYHMKRGDLALWAETSLGDDELAERFKRLENLNGEDLRKELLKAVQLGLRGKYDTIEH
ncbi:MAG: alpha-amylase [Methanotrichaceae archaeon]|nr:alpha-amylase [Methanotrichaceae archaeon]